MTEQEALEKLGRCAVSYSDCLGEFGEQEFEKGRCLCSACSEHLQMLDEAVAEYKRAREAAWAASLPSEQREVRHCIGVVVSRSVRPGLVIEE